MPAITDLTLADGNAVDQLFKVRSRYPNPSWAATDGVPVGDKLVSMNLSTTGTRVRMKSRIVLPTTGVEIINGIEAEKVLRSCYLQQEASFAKTSTIAERNDLRAFAMALMGHALYGAMMVDLEPIH